MFRAAIKIAACAAVCLVPLIVAGFTSIIVPWLGVPILLLTAVSLWLAIRGAERS